MIEAVLLHQPDKNSFICNVNSELQRDTTGTEKALSDLRKFSKTAEAQLKEKDAEIIRLKARLFDYMTKDQQ